MRVKPLFAVTAGGGFGVVGPTGIDICGTPVLNISVGFAGAGLDASQEAAKSPKEAADNKPGIKDETPSVRRPPKPSTYFSSARVLKPTAWN